MHCQEFPEQTDRTFLKQRSRSKGVPWVELKMMPMISHDALFGPFLRNRRLCLCTVLHGSVYLPLLMPHLWSTWLKGLGIWRVHRKYHIMTCITWLLLISNWYLLIADLRTSLKSLSERLLLPVQCCSRSLLDPLYAWCHKHPSNISECC